MENIYKIKIRSGLDPRDAYPSERRYSSSIVLGFSVMFLALTMTSALMGTLVVRRTTTINAFDDGNETFSEPFNVTSGEAMSDSSHMFTRVTEDLSFQEEHNLNRFNVTACISVGTFVMSIGFFLAACTGILAWKRWYIDNNITWFFMASCFSTITSMISLLLVLLSLWDLTTVSRISQIPPLSWGLTLNIVITSMLGVIWSVCASKISFAGMKSDYPDDVVLSNGKGRIESENNTSVRNNKNRKENGGGKNQNNNKNSSVSAIIPPDILNHFPNGSKLAKYFPRKHETAGNLPKEESNKEYQERVTKFLSQPVSADQGSGGDETNSTESILTPARNIHNL